MGPTFHLKGPQQTMVVSCQARPALPGNRDRVYPVGNSSILGDLHGLLNDSLRKNAPNHFNEDTKIGKPLFVLVHAAQPVSPHDFFLASVIVTNLGAGVTQMNSDFLPWCVI